MRPDSEKMEELQKFNGGKSMSVDYSFLLSQMTLEEKASMCSGSTFWLTQPVERLGIPCVWVSDGPNGLRKEKRSAGLNLMGTSETSTCFPSSATTANSWDVSLMKEIGHAIAGEAKALSVTTVLGPGVNIKRNPLCGRNFEYFSEDPFLSGRMGAAFINGVQSSSIGTSLKHFCANNEEHLRMSIDSVIDERTLREIYLSAFEYIVKTENPETVMCSYNRVNGEYMSENKRILGDILRDEWGYENIIVSDWGAVNDRVLGIKAGLDLEMPANNGVNDKKIVEAVNNGELSEEDLDKCVLRLLKFAFEAKEHECHNKAINLSVNHAVAKKAAVKSAVLLKNENCNLPVDENEKITVIGALAKYVRYQGAGSAHINPFRTVSFCQALDSNNIDYTYADGYKIKGTGVDYTLIGEACKAAQNSSRIIVFIGLTDAYESEGYDRTHMKLPESHIELIKRLVEINDNITVVLSGGSPVELYEFKDKVKSILHMYLGGQAAGEAAYDLIFGKENPCGKLAETYPLKYEDNIVSNYFPMGPRSVEYRESIFVGYRYYDSAKKDVAFPFGHGLSYTQFEYSDIKAAHKKDGSVSVTFKIKNTGSRCGEEIAQLYVKAPVSKIFKAEKELKGFTKIKLEPGEEKKCEINLDSRAFSYYNVNISGWHVEGGEYTILIGASSRDIRLKTAVRMKDSNPDAVVPDYSGTAPSYYKIGECDIVPDNEFEALYGKKLIGNEPFKKGELTINNSVEQVAVSGFGKAIYAIMKYGAKLVSVTTENPEMSARSAIDIPLRSFNSFTGGFLSQQTVEGMLDLCNGKSGGFMKMIKGFRK